MNDCNSNPVGGALEGVMLPLGWPERLKNLGSKILEYFVGGWADVSRALEVAVGFFWGVLGSNVVFHPGVGVVRIQVICYLC
jgi:hypothetical protein